MHLCKMHRCHYLKDRILMDRHERSIDATSYNGWILTGSKGFEPSAIGFLHAAATPQALKARCSA
ncbi:MAG: hypothetical protein C5S48_02850 [Candidatus Methanogaster sp.]|nr:MAG: hypothetical protein C5S48_02850 [ANME-2 cluster archaeon]